MPPELISLREYSKRKGCSIRAVQKAVAAGRISVVHMADGSKKVDPRQADLDWEKYTQTSKRSHGNVQDSSQVFDENYNLFQNNSIVNKCEDEIKTDSCVKDLESKTEGLDLDLKNSASFMEARRVREIHLAKLAKLEYEVETKKLISAADAQAKLYQAVRASRDALLNIPNRISSELSAISDPGMISELMTREIHLALEELSCATL